MIKTTEAPRKPDGTITTQINNQTFIVEVFFNHNSKETFQDKLMRVILAEKLAEPMNTEQAAADLPTAVSQ
jgi:hypothetical protein